MERPQRVDPARRQSIEAVVEGLAGHHDLVRRRHRSRPRTPPHNGRRSVCATRELQPIVLEPPEVLGVERLTNDGVVLRVVVKTAPGRQWELMRDLRSAIKEAFYGSDIVMVRR